MKLKFPPPVVALIFAGLMWGVSMLSNHIQIDSALVGVLSAIICLLGLTINILAAVSFRAAKTTMNPMKPKNATQLVNSGMYKLSRNPMYLGVLFILSAWALWLGSVFNIAVLFLFVWYITKFQIIPEEEVLESLFAEEFKSYKSNVRRWI